MFRLRPDASPAAFADGTNFSWALARRTRSRASGETGPRPLRAREAVAVDTLASAATSLMLATTPTFPSRAHGPAEGPRTAPGRRAGPAGPLHMLTAMPGRTVGPCPRWLQPGAALQPRAT